MTVQEIIEALSKWSPDTEVVVVATDDANRTHDLHIEAVLADAYSFDTVEIHAAQGD